VQKDETIKKDSTYVFDQVPIDSVKKIMTPTDGLTNVVVLTGKYTVQLGAFTTNENAESFSSVAKKKLNRDLTVKFSNEVNKFVVQLTSSYPTKPEADKERDDIRQFQEYKDAWTVIIK
jgi:hypothetical protein